MFFIWINFAYSSHRWVPYKSIFSHYKSYSEITEGYLNVYTKHFFNKNFKESERYKELTIIDESLIEDRNYKSKRIEFLRKSLDENITVFSSEE